MVKQLPLEMFQQCSTVSTYMWTHIAMEEPFVLNGLTQFLVFENKLLMLLQSLHEFHQLFLSQKKDTINFLAQTFV
jgi:hypothetical protein